MSLRVRGAVLSDDAVVSIVRGAVATVEGARLDRPAGSPACCPAGAGPSSGAWTARHPPPGARQQYVVEA